MEPDEKKELLRIAREALEHNLSGRPTPHYAPSLPALHSRSGAFVTLHRGEELRGCIGLIVSEQELFRTIRHCAISAATQDTRFETVTLAELPDLTIEISVLTPFRAIGNVEEIEPGRHGLMISRGIYKGLLLPQVAAEYRWDRETFLDQTCRKAGLKPGDWKEKGVRIQVFEAEVFHE